MKKAFYHNFFPTKAEEEAAKARNVEVPVTRTLVEIRDLGLSPPNLDPHPWMIRKSLNNNDIITGKLTLSHNEMFDHVFRYWTLDMTRHVINGNKFLVLLLDFTEEANPRRYQNENTFVEGGPNDVYYVGWIDVIRNRQFHPGDEIGLYWDTRSASFHFKLFRRAI